MIPEPDAEWERLLSKRATGIQNTIGTPATLISDWPTMVGWLSCRTGCEADATWQRQQRIGKKQQRRAAKFGLRATADARRATSRSGSGARISERHEREVRHRAGFARMRVGWRRAMSAATRAETEHCLAVGRSCRTRHATARPILAERRVVIGHHSCENNTGASPRRHEVAVTLPGSFPSSTLAAKAPGWPPKRLKGIMPERVTWLRLELRSHVYHGVSFVGEATVFDVTAASTRRLQRWEGIFEVQIEAVECWVGLSAKSCRNRWGKHAQKAPVQREKHTTKAVRTVQPLRRFSWPAPIRPRGFDPSPPFLTTST